MKQFFKFVFASFFGTILALFIGFFFFFSIVIAISSSFGGGDEEKVEIEKNSLLTLKLNSSISERKKDNEFEDFALNFSLGEGSSLSLPEILYSIQAAKEDEKISGIFLDLTMFGGGSTARSSIKDALLDFKASGKKIYAYADYYTESTYFLAATADSIFLQPTGSMDFDGSSMEMMFFKGAFEKLDIEPRVIKHGKFKSAGEPFTEKKMSDYNRKQSKALLQSIYTQYLFELGETRGIDSAQLRAIATELKIRSAADAVKHGLIDELVYRDQMEDKLAAFMGERVYKDVEKISISKYAGTLSSAYASDKIAVVYAVGSIGMGEGDDENIGAARISKAIKDARENESVRAIVLRVNSPGGSALASDVILREMALCKEAGMPTVVSMGDVAASGGYYISCQADHIMAQPTTLTGSIGVIGFIPGTQKFFENKLGITYDRIKTGPYADLGNPNREMTAEEEGIIQHSIDRIYKEFISHVALGRGLDTAYVNKHGQGRVWTGIQAKELGLVDELGNLEDAINKAAELALVGDFQIKEYPKLKNPVEEMIKAFGGSVTQKVIKEEIGQANFDVYKQLKWITSFDEPMMVMPVFIK